MSDAPLQDQLKRDFDDYQRIRLSLLESRRQLDELERDFANAKAQFDGGLEKAIANATEYIANVLSPQERTPAMVAAGHRVDQARRRGSLDPETATAMQQLRDELFRLAPRSERP